MQMNCSRFNGILTLSAMTALLQASYGCVDAPAHTPAGAEAGQESRPDGTARITASNSLQGGRLFFPCTLTMRPGSGERQGRVIVQNCRSLHRWCCGPTAACGENVAHLHCAIWRWLTVREAISIQTVSPDLPLSDQLETIGNGVSIKLTRPVLSFTQEF